MTTREMLLLLLVVSLLQPSTADAESLATASEMARKELHERAEKLSFFLYKFIDRATVQDCELLVGQLVGFGAGNTSDRGATVMITTTGMGGVQLRWRVHLREHEQRVLEHFPKGPVEVHAGVAKILRIDPKTRTIDVQPQDSVGLREAPAPPSSK